MYYCNLLKETINDAKKNIIQISDDNFQSEKKPQIKIEKDKKPSEKKLN